MSEELFTIKHALILFRRTTVVTDYVLAVKSNAMFDREMDVLTTTHTPGILSGAQGSVYQHVPPTSDVELLKWLPAPQRYVLDVSRDPDGRYGALCTAVAHVQEAERSVAQRVEQALEHGGKAHGYLVDVLQPRDGRFPSDILSF